MCSGSIRVIDLVSVAAFEERHSGSQGHLLAVEDSLTHAWNNKQALIGTAVLCSGPPSVSPRGSVIWVVCECSLPKTTLKPCPNYSVMSRMTRQGLPAANTPGGTSRVTTLPAPITARSPIFTPGQMIAPPPTQTSDPISTGLPNSCWRRNSALSGCVAV
jgi:hypothetical protein